MTTRPTNPSLKRAMGIKGKFVENVQAFLGVFSEDDVAHLLDTNITLEDLNLLVKLVPRLMHWFRERNHDHAAVLRDFERIDRDLGILFTDARRELREKYAQKLAASAAGPGLSPSAPAAPSAIPQAPPMSLEEASAIVCQSVEEYILACINRERELLGKGLTAIQRSRVVARAASTYERAVEIITAPPPFAFSGTLAPEPAPLDAPPPFEFSGTTPEHSELERDEQ